MLLPCLDPQNLGNSHQSNGFEGSFALFCCPFSLSHSRHEKEGVIRSSERASNFGFNDEELVGQKVSILVPSPWKEHHEAYLRMYHVSRSSRIVGQMRNLLLETKDHSTVPVSLAVTECRDSFQVRIERVDASIELVFTLSETGTIISCNTSFIQALLGYSASDLLHKSIALLVPNLLELKDDGSQSLTICTLPTVCTAYHKDGSLIQVTVMVYPFEIGDTHMFSCRICRQSTSGTPHPIGEQDLFPHLTLGPVIGRGASGVVRIGTLRGSGQIVAVKTVPKKDSASSRRAVRLQCEISILRKLKHVNIPTLHHVVDAAAVIGLVMEYVGGGTLKEYVASRQCLGDSEARYYFQQLVSVVSYIHGVNVIHRDIKADNILMLLHENWQKTLIKLCDFGLSANTRAEEEHTTFCGTPIYAAPELILSQAYIGPQVDVWSMGIVLFLMVVGNLPFTNVGSIIRTSCVIPSAVDASCAALIQSCLEKNPINRITTTQLSVDPWLTGRSSIPVVHIPIPATEVIELSSMDSFLGETSSGVLMKEDSGGHEVESKRLKLPPK